MIGHRHGRVDGRGITQLKRGYRLIGDRLRHLEAQRADLDKLLADMESLRLETLRLYEEKGGRVEELSQDDAPS